MTAYAKNLVIQERLNRRGIAASLAQASTLRRAEQVLHRWAELECGDGNQWASWSIERDEVTNKSFRCTYPHTGKSYRTAIADKEAGALKRIAATCTALGVHFYHQGDPRGCALYVSTEPLTDTNYSNGVAVCGGE